MINQLQITHLTKWYDIKNDQTFTHFSSLKFPFLPVEGFKIHISAGRDNWNEILNIGINFFAENNLNFKVITNHNVFIKSFEEKNNLLGKFITVYFRNSDELMLVFKKIVRCFKNFTAPKAITDRWLPGSNVVSYRYGMYSKGNFLDGTIDDRKYFRIPKYISDPFNHGSNSAEHIVGLTNIYKIVSLLSNKPRSSVFKVINQHNDEFIIKEVKKNFYDWCGKNEMNQRESEFNFSKELSDYLPAAIEKIEGPNSVLYVYQYLNKCHSNFDKSLLTMSKTDRVIAIEKIENEYFSLLAFIKELWSKRFILNDIASRNFIYCGNSKFIFIDAEYSYFLRNKKDSIKIETIFSTKLNLFTDLELDKLKYIQMIIVSLFDKNFISTGCDPKRMVLILVNLLRFSNFSKKFVQEIQNLASFLKINFKIQSKAIDSLFLTNVDLLKKTDRQSIVNALYKEYQEANLGEIAEYNGYHFIKKNGVLTPHINGGTLAIIFKNITNESSIHTIEKYLTIFDLVLTYKKGIIGLLGLIYMEWLVYNKVTNNILVRMKCLTVLNYYLEGE